jgi:hypothetical protein
MGSYMLKTKFLTNRNTKKASTLGTLMLKVNDRELGYSQLSGTVLRLENGMKINYMELVR